MNQIDEIMALLEAPEGFSPRVPLAPGSLATFAEELPAEPQHYRGPAPNRGAMFRMAQHDALPEAWRLLVHEHGTTRVMKQWTRLRSKSAEKARQALEVDELMRAIEAGVNWRG